MVSKKSTDQEAKKKIAPSEKKKSPLKKSSLEKSPLPPKKEKTPLIQEKKEKKKKIEDVFSGRKYVLGVGKRKTAVALVRLYEKGKGDILVNNGALQTYFFGTLLESALSPLSLLGKQSDFDATIKVEGGGVAAQSDAVRHGISRALVAYDEALRPFLKKAGFLTRDARIKERKKPGLRRARRAPQWAKR